MRKLHQTVGIHLKRKMILALNSAQRCKTLQALSLDNTSCADEQFVFYFKTLSKTSRPGNHLAPLAIRAYHPDAQLCPFELLKAYIERKRSLRGDARHVLISFITIINNIFIQKAYVIQDDFQ